MIPSSPIIHEGKTYNEYAVFLSSAPIVKEGTYKTAVNLTLIPMRFDEETGKVELLQTHSKSILYSDIRSQGDTPVLIAFGNIDAAIQQYINIKGL